MIRLRSKRLHLRYPETSDYPELVVRYKGSRELFRGLASSKYDREIFERSLASCNTETGKSFLICVTDSNNIAGQITLSQIFYKGFQNAYLGYHLFSGYTGRGFMTEAVDVVLRYAFDELKLHRVEANVQPDNKPSIAVLKRNGFAKEGFSRRYLKINGRWRDHERWALLSEDWKQSKRNVGSGSTK